MQQPLRSPSLPRHRRSHAYIHKELLAHRLTSHLPNLQRHQVCLLHQRISITAETQSSNHQLASYPSHRLQQQADRLPIGQHLLHRHQLCSHTTNAWLQHQMLP
jgi:hypothetical protein